MSSTTIFAVIGCHRDRSYELLLQGEDGRWYAWASPTSEPTLVEDDEFESEWRIDSMNDDPNVPNQS